MASNIGPLVSFEASAPLEWNPPQSKNTQSLIVKDNQGFGWSVDISSADLRKKLLENSTPTRLFIAQVIREDANIYFAFESLVERNLFLELRELDAIGPKMAALILASLSLEELSKVATGELKQIPRKISGLGPKIQEKLVLGLKQKSDVFLELLSLAEPHARRQDSARLSHSSSQRGAPSFVLQSMEGLGLRASDTETIWNILVKEDPLFDQKEKGEIIKRLLQEWGRHKNRHKSNVTEHTLSSGGTP